MPCDVLVFGSMGDIAQSVCESLRSHSLVVEAVPFPQNTFKDESGYVRTLGKALAATEPRLLMPVGNTLALARNIGIVPPSVAIPFGDVSKIELLDSKVEASRIAAEAGVRQPRFYSSPEGTTEGAVIFKREKSFGGSGVYRPKTNEALLRLMEHEPGTRYLIEDYIEGDDYSVDCIRRGDKFEFSVYRTVAKKQGQGPSQLRESVSFPVLGEYARRILEHIDYEGLCGMDFRVSPDSRAWFLECNPRFCGGLATQIASGFDIPWILWNWFKI